MADATPRTFFSGAALVWARQRILWLIYAVNFVIAYFATHETRERIGTVLNHSLSSDRLFHGFSIGAFIELVTHPESPFSGFHSGLFHSGLLFAIFMLFATGGVIATYYSGDRLKAGPFFEACGHHFWRFFRLALYLLIVLIPVGLLGWRAQILYDRIDKQSISPMPAVHFTEAAIAVILLLLACIRVWFDMAQVIAVAEDERRMHKALRRAGSLLRHNFGSLLWLYLRVSLLAWIVFGLGLHFWMRHLHSRVRSRSDRTLTAHDYFLVGHSPLATRERIDLVPRTSTRDHRVTPVYEPPPEAPPQPLTQIKM